MGVPSSGWWEEPLVVMRERGKGEKARLLSYRTYKTYRAYVFYRSSPSGKSGLGVVPSKNQLAPTFSR